MPLAEKTIKVVEATAPVVAAAGVELTAAFYKRMFSNNPELKDIFNMSHQENLAQPKALFDSVVAYATHLRQLEALGPAVERIAQKHVSFNIKPDQYQIVGHNLLKTIEEKLNPGQEVLDEWGKAYEQLANIFINREEEIYAEVEKREGGFRPTRAFKVAEKTEESSVITKFKLVPVDGKAVPVHYPGQFLAIHARHPSMPYQEIRQYSIISAPNNTHYEIAVRRQDKGQVSNYMHTTVNIGDELHLSPPYGDFFVKTPADAATPVVMISAGVGQTPLLCMLRNFAASGEKRPLVWLHGAHNNEMRAFRSEIDSIKKALPQLESHTWLSTPGAKDSKGAEYDFKGRMNLDDVPAVINNKSEYYCVGPHGFMASVADQLKAKGVAMDRVHYECFGPFNPIA